MPYWHIEVSCHFLLENTINFFIISAAIYDSWARSVGPFILSGPYSGPKAGSHGVTISTRRWPRDTAAGPRYSDYHCPLRDIFLCKNAAGALLPTVATTGPGVFAADSRRRTKQHLVTWYWVTESHWDTPLCRLLPTAVVLTHLQTAQWAPGMWHYLGTA